MKQHKDVFVTISQIWPKLLLYNSSDKERSEARDTLTAALNEMLHTEPGKFLAKVASRHAKHTDQLPAEYKVVTAEVLHRNFHNRSWVAIRIYINFSYDNPKQGAIDCIPVRVVEAHADWFENEAALKAEAEKYYQRRV